MATHIVRDIGQLVTAGGPPVHDGDPALAERALGLVSDAVLIAVDGVVAYAGPRAEAPSPSALPGPIHESSAGGRLVSPGLIDPHTHHIFAGNRSHEFDLRNQGKSYQQIQAAGGGILSTVTATDQASDEELAMLLSGRLMQSRAHGVVRCEVKTGYGLYPANELRLLRVIRAASQQQPVQVSPTFLCHVPPKGLTAASRKQLVDDLSAALPAARSLGADSVDVYCDEGAFTLLETEQILFAGRAAGLHLRCHAEQFTHTGAAALAARMGALSVEHLEEIDEEGIVALSRAGTVANLLPGAVVTLRLKWPDARRLLRAGVIVALGTDNNPGSSYSESLPLMMTLACTQMGLSCAEAWLAVTRNAAKALGVEAGRLSADSPADYVIWDAENYREVCQHFGVPLASRVFIAGQPVPAKSGRAGG